MMREKDLPDRSSISEVNIDPNNQNMITIVGVRPNIDDNFLSREQHGVYLDYVNKKRMLSRSQLF
jgi:hypothetical protein